MSKTLLKDFKSFMEEVSSGKGNEWYHRSGTDVGYSEPTPVLYKPAKKNKPGAIVGHNSEFGDPGKPWHTEYEGVEGEDSELKSHKTLKDAVAYLKSKGHNVPDHHQTHLKARTLKFVSDLKNKKD